MQQLALLYVMKRESQDSADLEWERFKMAMVANNPAQAKEILEVLETAHEPEDEVIVTEDGYDDNEKDFVIEELRRMGFAVQG